jgi:type IV conjugative transfer system protein TraL
MNSEKVQVTIKTLDNSPRILLWNVDEFLLLMAPILVGMCLSWGLMMPVGLVLISPYKRLKKKMPKGSYVQRMYWLLPTCYLRKFIKNVPASHHRELIL